MIPEIGHYALILALAMALVQVAAAPLGARLRDSGLMALARPAAVAQFVFISAALACLMQAFVVSDFSVVTVADNSHSAKPLLYKFTGTWGNHEGSMLLWVWILAVYGAAVAAFGRNLPPAFRSWVLGVQAFIGLGFLVFILATSNPFLRLDPAPFDGRDLNPLLQDPGLAFHPPLLYLGYVGLSTAFSFAVAALIEGRVNAAWARWVRPWTLLSWCALTAGIALGSWWAYYELGWGGYWFWDPVENASFMPWLMATALLHSSIVAEKRDSLKSWTVLLAILGFSLSLLGTFLVRSGVLTSVHSFASDPARGVYILVFLIIVVGGSLTLYAWRVPGMRAGGSFRPLSREGSLLANNLLLAVGCATVFIGTLYPLILDALAGQKVSVGPPFFESTFVPIMIPLLLMMAAGAVDGLEARWARHRAPARCGFAGRRCRRGGSGRGIRRRALGCGARHGARRLGGGGRADRDGGAGAALPRVPRRKRAPCHWSATSGLGDEHRPPGRRGAGGGHRRRRQLDDGAGADDAAGGLGRARRLQLQAGECG